ncbi:hypothetical protein PoB_004757200 [Plakobranchus ocellatus]|uniref:Uncharacterized protein n=1 Tax=Plakobranchus ocellatus TaxID=259542 RepID=A0AAV4BNX7_9GAST|nr:hypothetical protein PoB_004757200 [Plakobranchus ocellatus]
MMTKEDLEIGESERATKLAPIITERKYGEHGDQGRKCKTKCITRRGNQKNRESTEGLNNEEHQKGWNKNFLAKNRIA